MSQLELRHKRLLRGARPCLAVLLTGIATCGLAGSAAAKPPTTTERQPLFFFSLECGKTSTEIHTLLSNYNYEGGANIQVLSPKVGDPIFYGFSEVGRITAIEVDSKVGQVTYSAVGTVYTCRSRLPFEAPTTADGDSSSVVRWEALGFVDCGILRPFNLFDLEYRAKRLTCREGAKVARRWLSHPCFKKKDARPGTCGRLRVKGFACVARRKGKNAVHVRCKRRKERVVFNLDTVPSF